MLSKLFKVVFMLCALLAIAVNADDYYCADKGLDCKVKNKQCCQYSGCDSGKPKCTESYCCVNYDDDDDDDDDDHHHDDDDDDDDDDHHAKYDLYCEDRVDESDCKNGEELSYGMECCAGKLYLTFYEVQYKKEKS
eukprot:CFRG0988T1